MEWHKNRVFTHFRRNAHRKTGRSPTRAELYSVTIAQAIALRDKRMQRGQWLRGYFIQTRHPPRLCPRLILSKHAPGSEIQGIVAVYSFRRRLMTNGVKTCLACGCVKALLKQSRRARMVHRGTRPVNALLGLNPRV